MGRSVAGRLALGVAVIVFAPRQTSADVADYLGQPIVQVRLEIEGRPAREQPLLDILLTRPGRPLSMVEVRQSITHLVSLGRFEQVIVHAAALPGGVDLRYELVPVHPLSEIAFAGDTGAPGVDSGDLRRGVAERYGPAPTLARGADMARLIEELLAERGYLQARVTARAAVTHNPERATMVFDLAAGPRARIGAVEIVGSPEGSAAEVTRRLELAPGAPYEREAIAARVERYVAERRSRGYYEARLMVTPRIVDAAVVNLVVTTVPGPRVTVAFTGDPLPGDQHDDLVPVEAEGSADEDLLEDSSNRIVDYLRAQGYRDAAAPYTRQVSDGELRITFDVQRGPLYRVAAVEISGNQSVPIEELAPLVGVRVGRPFESARLDAAIGAVEGFYRRRGFAAAEVQAGIDLANAAAAGGDVPVIVRIIVAEHAQALVGSVAFEGNAAIAAAVLADGLGLQPGQPFFITQLALDRDALQLKYADLGFQGAVINGSPGLSADGRRADVVFRIQEGTQLFVDHVLIVGNVRISRETIERELQVRAGDPLGLSAVTESQRRLAALGLFRRARLTQVAHGNETTRDLLVTVEEAPATSLSYGPGVEVAPRTRTGVDGVARQTVELAPRGFFEIGRRNLFGKNRSINLFTSLSLQSNESVAEDALPGAPAPPVAPEVSIFGFAEYRVLGTFREPRVLGSTADVVLTGTLEQQSRTSFNFARRAFNADLIRRLTRNISVTGNYQIQRTELFDEHIADADQLLIDRLFPQVRLSSFSSSVVRDTRDDLFDPGAGHYFSALAQVAARRIGSEVGLLKSFLTAQLFRTLPHARGVVFAGSARVGLATGFARGVVRVDASGEPLVGANGQPIVEVVKDLPASERFFAGGDTTVRGFALDQLGTLNTFDKDGFPLGGNAVAILNAEMRVPLFGDLGAVGFLDAGNVFARSGDLDPGQMRSAIGFGVRYQSPFGPIRVDIGFKLNPRDIVPGHPESPRAVHISLGQAF